MSKKILVLVTVVIILFIGVFVKYAIPYYKNYTRLDEFEKHCYIFSGKADYSWYSDEMVEYEIRKTLKYAPVSLEELKIMVIKHKQGAINALNDPIGPRRSKIIVEAIRGSYEEVGKSDKEIDIIMDKKRNDMKQRIKEKLLPHYDKILEILNRMIEEK